MDIIKQIMEDLEQLDKFHSDLNKRQIEIHLNSLKRNLTELEKKLVK